MAKTIDHWRKAAHELQLLVEQAQQQRNNAITYAEHWKNKYDNSIH